MPTSSLSNPRALGAVGALGAAAAAAAVVGLRALHLSRRLNLDGKVVLVTGSSRGLGLAIARELAELGARLVLCARDEDELARAARDIAALGADVLAVPCNVAEKEQVDGLIERALDRFGRIDVLINNAGIIQVGPLESMTLTDFEASMATNFWASVYTTRAVLGPMRAQQAGRIVNITSIGGKVAVPHLLPYDAAKFALVGFSEGLRAELAGSGILVTTVVPGLMRTGSPMHASFKGEVEREFAWFGLGDALPFLTLSPEKAARRIIRALRNGDSEVVLGWQSKLLRLVHDLAPGLVADIMGVANRALPSGEGFESQGRAVQGREASAKAPGFLRHLLERQGRHLNETPVTP